ncbi:MAG TPA: hypothetical protein VHJ58_03940 [Vicinamibacterales bacterium]|jgi:hypothetical protein|nr:hypothetical protein [Vicinamibacterales bacterium]
MNAAVYCPADHLVAVKGPRDHYTGGDNEAVDPERRGYIHRIVPGGCFPGGMASPTGTNGEWKSLDGWLAA